MENLTPKNDIREQLTERLRLRQWRLSDGDAIIEFYSDPDMSKYVGGPRDEDDAWRGLALMEGHWRLKGFGYWAVEERQSQEFVGCIGLWQSPGWPEVELGYGLVENHQGKGYGTEAGRRCIEVARDDLSASSLVSYIDKENLPSIKMAEALGARHDGCLELASHGPHEVYRHF